MKRADGKTQTSISLREDLLDEAKKAASKEGRSLSNWIEQMLKEKFPDVSDSPLPTTPAPTSKKRGKQKE